MVNCSVSEEFSTENTEQNNNCSMSLADARLEVESQAQYNDTAAPQPDSVNTWSFLQTSASQTHSVSVLICISMIFFLHTSLA